MEGIYGALTIITYIGIPFSKLKSKDYSWLMNIENSILIAEEIKYHIGASWSAIGIITVTGNVSVVGCSLYSQNKQSMH